MTESTDETTERGEGRAGSVSPGEVDPVAFAQASWSDEQLETFRADLLDWYERHRRELPWRGEVEPYETWVAEVMLQQTQVSTVVDYYKRWLERLPDVEALARAEREEVMELWEGLGYYRRARFLHESAQELVDQRDGKLPESAEGLKELKGIGDYTAGAIASIAFDEAVPVVDGNVSRVLSRLRRVSGDPTATDFEKVAWAMADRLVDPDAPGDFNQAMMELGATVCTPSSPTCMLCPVSDMCEAFEAGEVEAYPEPVERRPRRQMRVLTVVVARPSSDGQEVLVVRRPADGLFGGLWEFPSLELEGDRETAGWQALVDGQEGGTSGIEAALPDGVDTAGGELTRVGELTHLLTHIEMTLTMGRLELPAHGEGESDEAGARDGVKWVCVEGLSDVPMSTAMRKVQRDVLSGG